MKKSILVLLNILLVVTLASPLYTMTILAKDKTNQEIASDELYHIVDHRKDGSINDKLQTASLDNAQQLYEDALKTYRNPAIYYQGKIMKIRYGIVSFKREATCAYNVSYTNLMNSQAGYTNACYGADAAYISTADDFQSVAFMISGVGGRASFDDVEILPLEKVKQLTSYRVKDGELYHQLKTSLSSKGYGSSIILDKAPAYLEADKNYYSYDGHAFYSADNKRAMMDDIRAGNDAHAINSGNPYYNYYQYLPHRSLSLYTNKQLQTYLEDSESLYRGITSYEDQDGDGIHDVWTQSLLANNSEAFLVYQNVYGANALMMMALAMNESAMGRSVISYQKNNLFGHAAFDSSAQESASRYDDVAQSVYSHAKNYISKSYLNPDEYMYHGGFFGDKQSGMNVSYASDPYWGEKAASYMYQMDKAMGFKDYQQYNLGIHTTFDNVQVYEKAKLDAKLLYETKGIGSMSFLITKTIKNKQGTWYEIQSDPVLDKKSTSYTYDFKKQIGYIKKDAVDLYLEADKDTSRTFYTITFDALGGVFENGSKKIQQSIREGMMPYSTTPSKKDMYFMGWKEELSSVKKKKTYHASYKKIKSLKWIEKPKQQYYVDDQLDVSKGKIKITFQDQSTKSISLTTEMVFDYHLDKVGKQKLQVKVGGSSLPYTIQVTSKNDKKEALDKTLHALVEKYEKKKFLSSDDKKKILKVKQSVNKVGKQFFTITDIRSIDKLFQRATDDQLDIIIDSDDKRIGVSGLSLISNLSNKKSHKLTFTILKDGSTEAKKLLESVSKNNNVQVDHFQKISILDGKTSITKFDTQVVVSLPKPKDNALNVQYMVLYSDGKDVVKMPTMQSKNKIVTKIDRSGTFALVHRSADAVVNADDVKEVNTTDKERTPWMKIILVGLGVFILLITGILMLRYRHKHKNRF